MWADEGFIDGPFSWIRRAPHRRCLGVRRHLRVIFSTPLDPAAGSFRMAASRCSRTCFRRVVVAPRSRTAWLRSPHTSIAKSAASPAHRVPLGHRVVGVPRPPADSRCEPEPRSPGWLGSGPTALTSNATSLFLVGHALMAGEAMELPRWRKSQVKKGAVDAPAVIRWIQASPSYSPVHLS
jgi:hypothetical protein